MLCFRLAPVNNRCIIDPVVGNQWIGFGALAKSSGRLCLAFMFYALLVTTLLMQTSSSFAATQVNTLITNVASASYSFQGKQYSAQAQASFLTQHDPNSPASPSSGVDPIIEFIRYNPLSSGSPAPVTAGAISLKPSSHDLLNVEPAFCSDANDTSGAIKSMPTLFDLSGSPLTIPSTYRFEFNDNIQYNAGEPIFVRVIDLDRNQDANTIENLVIDIISDSSAFTDQERLILAETSINSGEFIGYLQSEQSTSATHHDCKLSVSINTPLTARYQDALDVKRSKSAAASIDPYSKVFNTETGDLVDGFEVTLVDAVSGLPATVFGDDGVSTFPATLTSGSSVTDGANKVYNFPTGSFRFPVIPAGDYRLAFTNGLNWHTPTVLSDSDLLQLGAFTIGTGSRGETFTVNGSSLLIDVPIDPIHSETLLTKTSNKDTASVGDFIRYNISIHNGDLAGDDVMLVDYLPLGIRLIEDSVKLTKQNNEQAISPTVSANGRTLQFNLGRLDIKEHVNLSYVTKVASNAPLGNAKNTAQLQHPHLVSNKTVSEVTINEAFFTNNIRLFGRVHTGTCDGEVNDEGIEGIQLYLEDGTRATTDENGLWHLENITSGSHVVQLDTASLPPYFDLIECDTQGLHSGRNYSQFVDVQPGGFWRVDFLLKLKPPIDGQVVQQLTSQLIPLDPPTLDAANVGSNDEVQQISQQTTQPVQHKLRYDIDVSGRSVEVRNLRQVIILPPGVQYEAGTSYVDGLAAKDPSVKGQTLIYTVGNPGTDWLKHIQFDALISPLAKSGELIAKSMSVFNTPSQKSLYTPTAETSALLYLPPINDNDNNPVAPPTFASFSHDLDFIDQLDLDEQLEVLRKLKNVKLEIIGHTDNLNIRHRSRHIYKNNLALSLGRARQAANYLIQELHLTPDQISVSGQGSRQPVAQNDNKMNRSKNRRIEIRILRGDAHVEIKQKSSELKTVSTQGLLPGVPWDIPATAANQSINESSMQTDDKMPDYSESDLVHSDQSLWLWPNTGYSPLVPATKVAIKIDKTHRLALLVNGIPVSALNSAGSIKSKEASVSIHQWRGISLDEGTNIFEAVISDDQGNIIERLTRNVVFGGLPVSAALVEEKSENIANGKDTPIVAVQLFDKNNQPVRKGYRGKFTISAPYQSLDANDAYNSALLNTDQDIYYTVADQGIAYITLKPTLDSGEALLKFEHPNGELDQFNFWLKPEARDWIMVALAEGTLGYQDISGNLENARDSGLDDDIYTEGRVAFFAKGRIKGDWLVTAAYDSAKSKTTPFSRLIDPDRYYVLYADDSEQHLEASSAEKLYLRIEKDRFYSVYGDIRTELNRSELGRYERTLTGVKSVYNGKTFNLSVFASQTDNAFVREEIQGDGTSGLYHLKNKQIVDNTETLYLETRDRLHSETVIKRQLLNRISDYVIDYQSGTLFFKAPIHSTDGNFNPQFITLTYETDNQQAQDWVVGGRGGVTLLDESLEVGITAIEDNSPGNEKSLQAIDSTIELPLDSQLKVELAQSDNTHAGNQTKGTAVLATLEQRTDGHSAKIYYRKQDKDFGLEQQNIGESDREKVGLQSTLYINDDIKLTSQASHQRSLSTNDTQSLVESLMDWQQEQTGYQLGARLNQRNNNSVTEEAYQLIFGTRYQVSSALSVQAKADVNLNQHAYTQDKIQIGANYKINTAVTFYARHEFTWDKDNTQRTTAGLKSTPWQGAQLHQALEQSSVNDKQQLQAVHGLSQQWQINEQWRLSGSYNAASNLDKSALDNNQPNLNTENFYALSSSVGYHTSWLQFNAKAEYKDASTSDKWSFNTAVYQPNHSGLSLGGSLSAYHEKSSTLDNFYNNIEVDLAWHPRNSRWAILSRTNLINEEINNDSENYTNQRLVENLHVNNTWKQFQWYGQFGLKYVQEDIDSRQYDSIISYLGGELGYIINDKWDVSAHSRRLQDISDNNADYSTGFSAGWRPMKNTWVSLGYNFSGFIDEDFSAAAYSAQGVYIKLRIKADQDSLAELKRAFNY